MAFWNKEVSDVKKENIYTPALAGYKEGVSLQRLLKEQFKGEIDRKEIKFPVNLGEEHPFDFNITDGVYRNMGFVNAVIDKFIDFIVGPGFFITSDDDRAKEIIENFMQDVNFDTILRAWIKEALIKGNGFLEIGGSKDEVPQGMKVLNANYMYVERDKYGVIEGYNQYKGKYQNFSKSKVIPFKPYQIAHIPFNKNADDAYGYGVIYAALNTIDNLLQQQKDLHMLMNRKANSPMHAKLGTEKTRVKKKDVDAFGEKMEFLNNKHEWATDGLVDIKVVDFGNIGEKFDTVLNYDIDMMFYAFQVPSVLMGTGNINEGIANVQMDAFERRIQSIQVEVEKVIENDIFQRVLVANGIEGTHVEFEWGKPSSLEVAKRLQVMTEVMKIPTSSPAIGKLLEKEMVKLLKLNEAEYVELLIADEEEKEKYEEEERAREEERKQPIVPGQNAKPPSPVLKKNEKVAKKHVCTSACNHKHDEGFYEQFVTLKEWLGFNFSEYLDDIILSIKDDKFKDLLGTTKTQIAAGKFSDSQVSELKKVLETGFKKGSSMSEMAEEVTKKVKPKDLYRIKNGKVMKGVSGLPILSRRKEVRSIGIVRTEVTRVANQGAVKTYIDNGIKKVQWVSSFGPRTCPECEALNGKIYGVREYPDIPLHAMCRCTLVPITEVV